MRKTYTVDSGVQNENDIRFLIQEVPTNHEIRAAGQLITDTDENAFVYLVDDGEGYTYVQFPKTVWPLMAVSLGADKEPLLTWGQNEIVLENFKEELTMLIFNIEGNHNYGEEFANAVEEAFKEQLAAI